MLTDTNRLKQTLPDTLEPCQDGKHTILAQPWKAGIFSPGPFGISKCPYKIFTKMVGFCQFGVFYIHQTEIIKYSCSWSPCIWRARSIARRICGSALKCWFGEEIQMKLLLCCAFQCWWLGKLFKNRARWRLQDQWLWLKLFAKMWYWWLKRVNCFFSKFCDFIVHDFFILGRTSCVHRNGQIKLKW